MTKTFDFILMMAQFITRLHYKIAKIVNKLLYMEYCPSIILLEVNWHSVKHWACHVLVFAKHKNWITIRTQRNLFLTLLDIKSWTMPDICSNLNLLTLEANCSKPKIGCWISLSFTYKSEGDKRNFVFCEDNYEKEKSWSCQFFFLSWHIVVFSFLPSYIQIICSTLPMPSALYEVRCL